MKKLMENEIVIKYKPFVSSIVFHIASKLPSHIPTEDLMQWGMIGLIKAHRRYKPTRKASFKTYAGIRIRGAVLDCLRKDYSSSFNLLSRRFTQTKAKMDKVIARIEMKNFRPARNDEIAKEMNMKINEFYYFIKSLRDCDIVSLDNDSMNLDEDFIYGDSGLDYILIDEDDKTLEEVNWLQNAEMIEKAIQH